ncbi:MAG TPA: isoprenylcysteine carboxylmethyltransferase family protein, partial [Burkholderiales bacterium]|nr:isoprenylcysteine carboxylmethyltransferase family protein [Burkholderiales bacterium]
MSLPLEPYHSALAILEPPHLVPALALAVGVLWGAAELLTLPRSRRQLEIPRGDWLTVSLGVLPPVGVAASVLWQWLLPPAKFHPALVLPSLVLCLAGIGLRIWSKIVLGRYYTFAIGLTEDHRILAEGPYRFVRHPIYLGTFLAVAGFPLLTQSWATVWFLTVPAAVAYGLRLFKEEAYLVRHLGENYQTYAQRTARLIPFI